uniref:Uncharacterized protein n=1 Tax=Mycoplasma suis TaxID=57372 RepID=Q8KM78_9MOLU|nr:hypothetical protein [Mycoplasma suis]
MTLYWLESGDLILCPCTQQAGKSPSPRSSWVSIPPPPTMGL